MPVARRLALAVLFGTCSAYHHAASPRFRALSAHPRAAVAAKVSEVPTKTKRPRLPRSRTAPRKVVLAQAFAPTIEHTDQLCLDLSAETVVGPDGEPAPPHSLPMSGSNRHYPALVLNADYRPLSYLPLSIMSWQEAIKMVCRGTVHVVATYDRFVRSPSVEIALPSVLVLKKFSGVQSGGRQPALTRRNLFLRDGFECQYCGARHAAGALTYDHVLPRSKGGKTTWENTVTACGPCNNRKGSRLLKEITDMQLRALPRVPNWHALNQGSKAFPPKRMHESWVDFFY